MTRRPHGFTLLEVLVALTVLATALTALVRLVGTSARTLGDDARHARAVLAARALLAEAELSPPAIGHREGERSDGLHWEEDVTPTPHPRLRQVAVRVFPTRDRAVTVVEVVRVPAS